MNNQPEVDLNHIATFAKVVQTESFTLAAAALGVPKSTVSRRVSGLEASLGVRLLRRTTRKLSLTEAGRAYFDKASRALEAIEEAGQAVADMDGEPRGLVRITAPVDIGTELVADVLVRFASAHPNISLEVSLTSRRIDLVEEAFDLAVRAGPLSDSSLIARRLGTACSKLYASPAYIETAGTPKKLSELADHANVVFRPGRGGSSLTLTGPTGPETVQISPAIGADDFTFVRRVLIAGVGVGLLPVVFCRNDVAEKRLVPVLPKYALTGADLHLVYPSGRYMPQRVTLVRDFLVKELTPIATVGAATKPR